MAYRVGLPGWKALARAGFKVSLRVDVLKDEEAGVFVATSPDLHGLIAESASLEGLITDVNAGIADLLEDQLHQAPRQHPETNVRFDGGFCAA